MIKFFVVFLLLLGVLFGLELTPPAQEWFVVPWTDTLARISAGLVTWFDPNVTSNGKVLRSSAFILAVLAWLPLTFAVWYFAAPLILWPSVLLMEGVARVAFPDLVRSLEPMGATVGFMTSLRPGTGVSGGFVSVDVNLLL